MRYGKTVAHSFFESHPRKRKKQGWQKPSLLCVFDCGYRCNCMRINVTMRDCDGLWDSLLAKLGFGGESPLTMRARCSAFRYFPDPLGIVTA